jgi:hypothetical protein
MPRLKIFTYAVLAILTLGLITLWVYQDDPIKSPVSDQPDKEQSVSINLSSPPEIPPSTTPAVALEESLTSLQASLSGLLDRIENLELTTIQTTTPADSSTSLITFQPQTIYLGSTTSNKRDWTDSGAEVIINSADYPADVAAVFEAGLSIAGGEAWARLKNKTTGAIISITEVSHNTSTVTWKTSPSFKLHPGNYTYIVQLRSTSGETANLSGARLKISR